MNREIPLISPFPEPRLRTGNAEAEADDGRKI